MGLTPSTTTRAPAVRNSINVAVVGVGNNASALVQGWARLRETGDESQGKVAGYSVSDVRFTCAFDVSVNKTGKDLSAAIFVPPTNFPRIYPVRKLGVPVILGPRLDSVDKRLASLIAPDPIDSPADPEAIATRLREGNVNVVVNFLPTGSPNAGRCYATAAALAGCAFINATPDPIVHDSNLVALFEERGLPLLGDDLESQMGATVLHRAILETLASKGLVVTGSYQINVGGNMDFQNLAIRGEAKARSKLRGLMISPTEEEIHVIPAAACFPFLGDRKIAHIRVETEGWLGSHNSVDIQLEIQDSSSAAAVVADLIRIAKYELDLGRSGVVDEASFYFKSPQNKRSLHNAEILLTHYRGSQPGS